MSSPFYHDVDKYTNKLNPLEEYHRQVSFYIHKKTGCSIEEARTKAKKVIMDRFKDRGCKYFLRLENGDRTLVKGGLYQYIRSNIKQGNILSPSFTSYLNSEVKQSLHSEYILENVEDRAIAKKEAQKQKALGNEDLAESLNRQQNNKKIKNNEVSGLYASKTSAISNQSAHSTLTSLTRTITSLSNACNERIMEDNRAFYTPLDVLNSITNEATYIDEEIVQKAIAEFGLKIPTTEEVVATLQRSSNLYWKDQHFYDRYIIPFLNTLSDAQRAGIVYTLSLYNLIVYNKEVMTEFYRKFTEKATGYDTPLEDPWVIARLDTTLVYFAHSVFSDELRGFGKDYERMNEAGLAHNLYQTCLNIQKVIEEFSALFEAFFRVNISPINSNKLEYMRRRPVVLSDTDSSAFSTDRLIRFFKGIFMCNSETIGISSGATFKVSETIVHQLMRFSNNINIEKKNLKRLAMKNEYFWSAHAPTEITKHYFGRTIIVEGNIYSDPEMEVKGVHLRSSNVATEIISRGIGIMETILTAVSNNADLKLMDILKEAVDIENKVISETLEGSHAYLKRLSINTPESYKQSEEESNYRYYTFWKEVLEDKYGDYGEPPYTSLKVPLTINNKTDIKDWLDSIEDEAFKKRLDSWLKRNARNSLPNVYLYENFIRENGIPKEFMKVLDIENVVMDMTTQMRTIIESLGIVLNEKLLIKDQFLID